MRLTGVHSSFPAQCSTVPSFQISYQGVPLFSLVTTYSEECFFDRTPRIFSSVKGFVFCGTTESSARSGVVRRATVGSVGLKMSFELEFRSEGRGKGVEGEGDCIREFEFSVQGTAERQSQPKVRKRERDNVRIPACTI